MKNYNNTYIVILTVLSVMYLVNGLLTGDIMYIITGLTTTWLITQQ